MKNLFPLFLKERLFFYRKFFVPVEQLILSWEIDDFHCICVDEEKFVLYIYKSNSIKSQLRLLILFVCGRIITKFVAFLMLMLTKAAELSFGPITNSQAHHHCSIITNMDTKYVVVTIFHSQNNNFPYRDFIIYINPQPNQKNFKQKIS